MGTMKSNHTCYICGRDNCTRLFRVEGREIIRCKRCSFVFTYPAPDGELYEEAFYFTEKNQYLNRSEEFRQIFNNLLDQIHQYKQGGYLLDVGCGPGLLLDVARTRGWQVAGVEISRWAAHYANEKLNIPVICGELNSAQFEPGYFDVIIANHVLEHMPDPRNTLVIMRHLLRDDGIIAIGVPNIDSLMAIIKRSRWQSLLPEQHLWHFSPRTLNKLLYVSGFEVIYTSTENHKYSSRNIFKRICVHSLSRIALLTGRGESIFVIAKKT